MDPLEGLTLEKKIMVTAKHSAYSKIKSIYKEVLDLSLTDISKYLNSYGNYWVIILLCVDPIEYANEIFRKRDSIIENKAQLSGEVQGALLLRLAKAACHLKRSGELSLLLDALSENSPTIALCAYLYLTAQTGHPIDPPNFQIGKCDSFAALTLYYYGVNLIFLANYEKAQIQFMHAMTMKQCPKEVASEFALACFLRGFSLDFVNNSLDEHFQLPEYSMNLFEMSRDVTEFNKNDYPPIYRAVWKAILLQFRKRKVIFYSKFVQKIKKEDLLNLIGDVKVYQNMIDNGEINVNEDENGIITFSQTKNSDSLQNEIMDIIQFNKKLNK